MPQYLKKARRIGYIRWRTRTGKDVKDEDLTELLDYVAEIDKIDRATLAMLASLSIDDLRKMTVEKLEKLAHGLVLIETDEKTTKGKLVDCISGFKEEGYIAR